MDPEMWLTRRHQKDGDQSCDGATSFRMSATGLDWSPFPPLRPAPPMDPSWLLSSPLVIVPTADVHGPMSTFT